MIGISLQLNDASGTPKASLSGIQALWWDIEQPGDAGKPIGRSVEVVTDANGYINLDLSNVSGLTIGSYGFLTLYKLNTSNHEDSLTFSSKLQTSSITSGVTMQPVTTPSTWKRNPSWLPMPTVTEFDQMVVGLHRVDIDANFVAFNIAGAYHVDWGDGTSEDVATGVTAQHQYTYSDTDLAGSNGPVTFTDIGDLVNRTSHGHVDNDIVQFYGIVSTTGLVEGESYYVVNAATDYFQVSATLGGSALTLTTNGSANLLPYKQALITVIPQPVQSLTSVNLHVKHNQSGLQTYSSGFLDIAIAGQYITDLRIGVQTPGTTGQLIRLDKLEQINIVKTNLKQCASLLYYCTSLSNAVNFVTSPDAASSAAVTFQDTGDTVTHTAHGRLNGECVIFRGITSTTGITVNTKYFVVNKTTDTYQLSTTYGGSAVALTTNGSGSAVYGTNFSSMFSNCYSLTSIPLFNTAAGIDFSTMFSNCYSLTSVPLLNTAAGTAFSSMFSSCYSLTSIPLLNTEAGVYFSAMFSSCYALTSIPLLNTGAGTDFASMFSSCYALTSIPLLNTAAGTAFSSMFSSCYSLTSIPLLNTEAGVYFSNMFVNCSSLTSIPLLNTISGLDFNFMFSGCYALTSIPLLNTAAALSFSFMFNGCSCLTSIPLLNTRTVGAFTSMFSSCPSLTYVNLVNTTQSISYASCKLSATQLDSIYTNLGYVGTGSVTFQVAANTVTKAAHGLVEGQFTSFASITGTTNITNATNYYVRNPTANTFQLSATKTGAIIDLTGSDGTGTFVARTITVTGNYGVTSDTPSIATAKGWTVTG